MLMQRDQPENRLCCIKTTTYFAEYLIPRLANLFDEKVKQWGIVAASLLPAMHCLALCQQLVFGFFTISPPAILPPGLIE